MASGWSLDLSPLIVGDDLFTLLNFLRGNYLINNAEQSRNHLQSKARYASLFEASRRKKVIRNLVPRSPTARV